MAMKMTDANGSRQTLTGSRTSTLDRSHVAVIGSEALTLGASARYALTHASPELREVFLEEFSYHRRTLRLAYISAMLPFPLFSGSHYLYLRQFRRQFLFWISLGGLGVWWTFDLVRMADLVYRANRGLSSEILADVANADRIARSLGSGGQSSAPPGPVPQQPREQSDKDTFVGSPTVIDPPIQRGEQANSLEDEAQNADQVSSGYDADQANKAPSRIDLTKVTPAIGVAIGMSLVFSFQGASVVRLILQLVLLTLAALVVAVVIRRFTSDRPSLPPQDGNDG